ncbi:MAG: hypothetical protein O3A51_10935 [Verrucomicrobia bacterium]|nr:hypothetical protein [Verrucomicrobiota bacterium]
MTVDEAFERVAFAHDQDRMAQAYLICGNPREEGRQLAERIIQRLYCQAESRPCGTCRTCRQARERTHPDLLWIEPQKKSRRISVDQVRGLLQRMQQTAYEGSWKVCVLSGADRLGPEGANAFLKTLEEPAGRALFLLLSDSPQSLLPTILSRCQSISLSGSDDAYTDWDERLLVILSEAPRPFTRDEPGPSTVAFAAADRVTQLMKAMKEEAEAEESERADEETLNDGSDVVSARGSALYRERRAGLLKTLLNWYRDVLMIRLDAPVELLYFPEYEAELRQQAEALSFRQAMSRLRTIESIPEQFERNMPEHVVLGSAFGQLAITV